MCILDREAIAQLAELASKMQRIDLVSVVRCKNCKRRQTDGCPMYSEEWVDYDEGYGYYDSTLIIHDHTIDDGFCYCGERIDGEGRDKRSCD